MGCSQYPNATVTEHGDVSGADNMAKEVRERSPNSTAFPCVFAAVPVPPTRRAVLTVREQIMARGPIACGVDAGPLSRRRGCHSAAPLLTLAGVSIGMERECQ